MFKILTILLCLAPGDLITIGAQAEYTDVYNQQHISYSETVQMVVLSPVYQEKPVYLAQGWSWKSYNKLTGEIRTITNSLAAGMKIRIFIYGKPYDGIQLANGDILIDNTIVLKDSPILQLPFSSR
jgi:hypothetical protein